MGSTLTESHRKIISDTRKRDWAAGNVYTSASVGRTKWHTHIKPDGTSIRLQGTWELLYAIHLDVTGVEYKTHEGAFWYTRDVDHTTHVYLPDFFLVATGEYVDVKNDYLLSLDAQKIEDVKRCHPKMKLRIVTKKHLQELGLMN